MWFTTNDFNNYFENEWIDNFKDGKLDYENLYIKFRFNICLEKFNRKFKSMPNMEKFSKGISFIDNIIDEVSTHIDILETEMKKILN